MYIFALTALAIFLVAAFQIARVLIHPPAPELSLLEMESEMLSLDAECALAIQRAREESTLLTQPNP